MEKDIRVNYGEFHTFLSFLIIPTWIRSGRALPRKLKASSAVLLLEVNPLKPAKTFFFWSSVRFLLFAFLTTRAWRMVSGQRWKKQGF